MPIRFFRRLLPLWAVLGAVLALLPAACTSAEEIPIRRTIVVLDPGHGGDDPGFRSESLPAEKTLSLELARELQKRLQRNPELEIILTRSQDKRVSLLNRQETANLRQADVFVSLHMLMTARTAKGTPEIYFFYGRFVTDDSLAAQAAREVAAGARVIPWDLAQNALIKQSRRLGNALARGWETGGGIYNLQRAPLLLLTGLHCPAVMAELACPADGRSRANDRDYCEQAAQALAGGLEAFLDGR